MSEMDVLDRIEHLLKGLVAIEALPPLDVPGRQSIARATLRRVGADIPKGEHEEATR